MNSLSRKALSLVMAFVCASFVIGCSAQAPSDNSPSSQQQSASSTNAFISDTSFAPETETAINDFIAAYGKSSPDWNGDAYVVSDFDNTTATFDITYQCNVYQLQTMAFALDPSGLRAALAAGLDEEADENTSWLDDIETAYRYLWETYGPFTPSGLDEQDQAAIQADAQWMEFATKMKAFYNHVEETVDDPTACEWVLHWYSGMTEDEVYDLFKRSCDTYDDIDTELVTWTSPESIKSRIGTVSCEFPIGVSVTDDVKAMLKAFSENGIDVWICSASHVDGVRAAVDVYGLGEYVHGVIGMTQKAEGGTYVPAYDWDTGYTWVMREDGTWRKTDDAICALPSREGKVQAVENALVPIYGCGPLAGFMDASGDFNFCTELDSMKMVICYNRADRKITDGAGLVGIVAVYQQESLGYDLAGANAAGDTYYLLQGRDENGKRTLRPSSETMKLGQAEPKLFANADNDTLLAYLKANNLTTAEVFDTFAVCCEAKDSRNVLGITYGYLEQYDGYHSHNGRAGEEDALKRTA